MCRSSTLRRGRAHARRVVDCGSRMSRRPSPSRLRPSTVKKMARPGNTDSHGAVRDLVARLRQHAAPAREGRADAEAEERQRGFGQDRAAHAERGDHDQRPQDVGQHLGEHDAQVAVAQDARGLDVALALERQHLRAGDAAGVGPAGEAERDHQAEQAGPEDRHDGEREDQRGDRQHQVGEAAHQVVPPAAPVAGGEAERDADQAVADLAARCRR